MYDVTNKKSFEHIESWLKEIELYATNEMLVKLLVGNKIDKEEEEREVSKESGQDFARNKEMVFIEASAKTTIGIQQAFNELVQKIMDVPELVQECSTKKSNNVTIDDTSSDQNNNGYCGC